MSSDSRKIIFNTRERALSSDFNDMTALLHRQDFEMAVAMSRSAFNPVGSRNTYGVMTGMLVSATGTDLTAQVGRGVGVKYDPANQGNFDSAYRLIEVLADIDVDLTSLVDPTNPRWVVIEIEPGVGIESSSLRDKFNPATQTFAPQTVTKVEQPVPVVSARAGTPSAGSPPFPAGQAGRIPLAYVYVPGGAVTINPNHIIRCRPIFNPMAAQDRASVVGGGVDVPGTANGVTTIAPCASSSFLFAPAYCGFGVSVDMNGLSTIDLSTAGDPILEAGVAYPPASTRSIYFYVTTAPYPAGYDLTIAPREFRPVSPSTIEGIIPSYFEGMENGIVVGSLTAPTDLNSVIAEWPNKNLGVNDPTWGGGPGANLDQQVRTAYLGAVTYFTGGSELRNQRVRAAGWVYNVGDIGFFGIQTDVESSGGSSTNNSGSMRNTLPLTQGGDVWAPATSEIFMSALRHSTAGASSCSFEFRADEPGGANFDRVGHSFDRPNAGQEITQWVAHAENGAIEWDHACTSGSNSTIELRTVAYVDSILARR